MSLVVLFHGSFTGDTEFMLWLLVPPLLSCSVGLAGNIIVMTGHSLWNLINSISVAGLNLLFNYLLIPKYGILGAAYATALAATAISIAQLVEARYLVGARIYLRKVYKPWVSALPATAVAICCFQAFPALNFLGRLGFFGIALLAFGLSLKALGLEQRDKDVLTRSKKISSPTVP